MDASQAWPRPDRDPFSVFPAVLKAQFGVLEQSMVQMHLPFPHATALFVATVEFACDAELALGLLTPLCSRET
jgi:uncharacterized membrane protein YphA (DoxX/SURF4 family)